MQWMDVHTTHVVLNINSSIIIRYNIIYPQSIIIMDDRPGKFDSGNHSQGQL